MKNQHTLAFSLGFFGEEASGEIGEHAPLPSGDTGEHAPSQSSNAQQPKTAEQRFDELVNGEFKEVYQKRVSGIVQKRLKSHKQEDGTKEFMDALFARYGVEQGNLTALQQTLLGEDSDPSHTNALAGQVYEDLFAQSVALKEVYPSFELTKELENPTFSALLALPGVEMQTAYELTHKEEILPALIAATAKDVESRIAKGLLSGGIRPAENGTLGGSPSLVKRDVSTFTKEQMEDICRRVQRGEKIYL